MGRETRRNLAHDRVRVLPSSWAALDAHPGRARSTPGLGAAAVWCEDVASVPAGRTSFASAPTRITCRRRTGNGEGFDNKIAALLAKELGDSLAYVWWPQRRGFIRNTLRSRECDLVLGLPIGYDPVLSTKPYYRSTYYLVYATSRQPSLTSLDDSALKRLRIGVNLIGDDYAHTPPVHALLARGISANVVGYSSFYGEDHHPGEIIAAVERGDIDVAIAWGPMAGYFAKRAKGPADAWCRCAMTRSRPCHSCSTSAIGVRRSDRDLKARLDEIVDRLRPAIAGILEEYHVPTVTWPAATTTAGDKR
jgi:quinoprotein dehydrogenase-associated probable ABC transporter substrate-binding protein